MTKDNRQFTGRISVRIGTAARKLELSPAPLHGGAEGLFRVRVNRRWHDHPDGGPLFFDRAGLAELAAALAFDALPEPSPAPDIPRHSRVTVKYYGRHDDLPHWEGVWTATPPVRGHDGRWRIGVMTAGAGFLFVPAEDVTLRERSAHGGDAQVS